MRIRALGQASFYGKAEFERYGGAREPRRFSSEEISKVTRWGGAREVEFV